MDISAADDDKYTVCVLLVPADSLKENDDSLREFKSHSHLISVRLLMTSECALQQEARAARRACVLLGSGPRGDRWRRRRDWETRDEGTHVSASQRLDAVQRSSDEVRPPLVSSRLSCSSGRCAAVSAAYSACLQPPPPRLACCCCLSAAFPSLFLKSLPFLQHPLMMFFRGGSSTRTHSPCSSLSLTPSTVFCADSQDRRRR